MALFATDNEWGIPVLDLAQQATILDAPFARWGRERRKSRMRGTWHFYTDDYRFAALWGRPQAVVNSGCVAAVEPNFSVHEQTPRAVALYKTFQKRYLARLWQEHGVRVLVDLNVAPEHAALNLLGVPAGWRSYATRGNSGQLEAIELEYEAAASRAGCAPLFVVYGGGKAVRALSERRGWIWMPEEADTVRERQWAKAAAQVVAAEEVEPAGRSPVSRPEAGPTSCASLH